MAQGGHNAGEGVRGTCLYNDTLPEFNGGKITISVISFLRYTCHRKQVEFRGEAVPPNGQVSLWVEEARIPEAAMKRARK